ncbi:hypothetical protein LE181_02525 [Streptomyces sp. SCA3-4]|uniref:hypothetical protein n=1 Tax=Streptomyces sichuanensis TaxID=2871810 RepID=UPI001CE359E8|nr:hypothetical protein [Streptomyces sichuanensis]MCA6091046.1 hypothetical protein [Streptomyces sichuanensis]
MTDRSVLRYADQITAADVDALETFLSARVRPLIPGLPDGDAPRAARGFATALTALAGSLRHNVLHQLPDEEPERSRRAL